MNKILDIITARLNEEWIIGYDSQQFYKLTQNYLKQFTDLKQSIDNPRIILVNNNNNFEFLAAFLASIMSDYHVFLCDKKWQEKEWKEVLNLVKPNLILGLNIDYNLDKYTNNWQLPNKNLIMIPTGGTSGNIRFAIHTWETLSASVQGFIDFFELEKVNSFCVLPLHHVSGLMQFMRSFLTRGKIIIYPYSNLKKEIFPSLNFADYFISLVPTQLHFLLTFNPEFLKQFKTILLGGASPWNSLLTKAREYKLNLSPTYGMTETASQVVTLKPENFLQNNKSTGQILPHAQINLTKERLIKIKAKSLYFGYYPNYQLKEHLITDDLGYFDEENYLYILGRNSQKIITGGENVFPKEIENVILETNLVQDIAIIGVEDEQWGEVVTAIYVPQDEKINVNLIKKIIKQQLSPVKQPKYWVQVQKLPRNQQGKLNYQILQKIAKTYLNQKNPL
ncbi:2-succinylbenzoate--CoA ligase [Crocosphaera sp.]|uniref:2-succinylbenzoate--CoA ligase n=1 Tax=Crocosphaera sp. TaxID=2729996 RepID=UPI002602EDDC|nr:2-succinylbenzoate--CoA ligase [Crocosphaera sp.]MDJ0579240.1 2-succinylbenzoate--CoA ligase [Crocosphaera sp.]